jgi:uroporphyrinogen-III synthase
MRVLLTRPEDDSERLVAVLARRGIEAVVAPLVAIVPRAVSPELAGVRAILLTSANGARMLARATARRDLDVLAVGAATAAAAREAGFRSVASAEGDVAALARLAIATLRPDEGELLHVAGSDVAGDLAGRLRSAGFRVRRAVLYDAEAATALPEAAAQALAEGRLDAVLLFSPRTAATFVSLVRGAGLAESLRAVEAVCLSGAVAGEAAGLPWRAVRVAARPDQAALLSLLDDPAAGDRRGRAS